MSTQSWAGVRERLLRVASVEAEDGQSVTGQSIAGQSTSEQAGSEQAGSDTASPGVLPSAAECVAPPLTADEVAHLEAFLGIALPEDYRSFLCEVSAGGYGPSLEFFTVEKVDEDDWVWEGDGGEMTLVESLAAPFDPTLSQEASSFLESEQPWEEGREDELDEWYEQHDDYVWDEQRTAGAIFIAHAGCALRYLLVVSGPHRGQVWYDGRVDDPHQVEPVRDDSGAPLSFYRWFMTWLEGQEKNGGPASDNR